MSAMLELRDVEARYGQVQALHGISLEVPEGEISAVLGANGAGKTTTLRAISGTVRRSGEVLLQGTRLRGGPEAAARAGIAHVPEGRGTFTELSVLDNLRLGAYTRRDRAGIKQDVERMGEWFPWIGERRDQEAGTLSGGEQQMLALARALMARPRLLLLDEPSLGLAPILVDRIYETVAEINRQGTTILLVEQNANFALEVSKRGYVLETAQVALSDSCDRLRENPDVQKAYLGG